jgi:subtilisin family serine protease
MAALGFAPLSSSAPATPVKVAVIDTGMDVRHPLLKTHIWTNPGESGYDPQGRPKATNGVDDDGNGYIDDLHGWNFADESPDVSDDDGHGTHIGGVIVQAAAQNSRRILFQLLPIKYFSKTASPYLRTRAFVEALKYAVQQNVDVINISGGGPAFNEDEWQTLKEASSKGILIVASAGNKKPKAEDRRFYPAAYDLTNIISVVATDPLGHVLPTSNLNANKENLFALGQSVYSSLPHNRFGRKTGSSQAAALLTGEILSYVESGRGFNKADLQARLNALQARFSARLYVANSPN